MNATSWILGIAPTFCASIEQLLHLIGTDRVYSCPVDCFSERRTTLVMPPDECIACTLCVAECPVEAIFAEDDVPAAQRDFIPLNAELAKVWKPLVERKPA